MTDAVPASEFTRNFGRYRMLAQREGRGGVEPWIDYRIFRRAG